VSITATPVNSPGVQWSTSLNLDGIENEVMDLGPQAEWTKYFKALDELGNEVNDSTLYLPKPLGGGYWVGFPQSGVWQRKVTGYDPTTNTHSRSALVAYRGAALPTFNASWSNTLSMGPFRLFALVSAEAGARFKNSTRMYSVFRKTGDEYLSLLDFENRDSSGNPTATRAADSLSNFGATQGTFIDKRDHVRLREVSVTYQAPAGVVDALGLSGATLTFSGHNLHWWDDCHCLDPNLAFRGGDSFSFGSFLATPQPRQFLFTVRARF
jgi:hypothetical protein